MSNEQPPKTRKPLSRSPSNVEFRTQGEDVRVVLTQAFGPKGDNLIGISDAKFDDHPALTLRVKAGDQEGLTHISPIHGDARKAGSTEIAPGTKCELFCPVSNEPLPKLPPVPNDEGTTYYAIYLTPELTDGAMVGISNVWGHYHSRVVDNYELIATWMEAEADLD